MNNILSKDEIAAVHDILVEQLGVERAQLTPNARMEEDLGSDSLLKVEIIMALEERFKLTIPDELVEKVSTVGDVQNMLADALAGRT